MTSTDNNTVEPADPIDTQSEMLDFLSDQNAELSAALQKLSGFQESMLVLRRSQTPEDALDNVETLLEEIVDFSFMRFFMRSGSDKNKMDLVREICPQEYEFSWEMVNWALKKQEISLIPLPEDDCARQDNIKSILLMPLTGHNEAIGVLLFWVEFDMDDFTHGNSTLLNMLARETASVLEQMLLRHRVENARAELADIVENIPLGILAIDENEKITMINGTSEFIFGVNRNDALNAKLSSYVQTKSMDSIRAQMQGDISSDDRQGELELRLADKMEETFGVSTAPIRLAPEGAYATFGQEEEEATYGHVIVCRDLKLSREVAKLRELDAMKNDFLSLVSHELRTPLTSILAYSETLLMDGMVETEEERKEYLEIIHSEGERLSRLINDVLDLTKMESGKLEFIYEQLNITEIINSALAAVHSLSAKKNISMPTDYEENIPLVKADSDRIIQVLTNLYSNSIKFTDEGGSITSKVRKVEDKKISTKGVVEVSVTDTGIGIKPEDIHKVFSKFEMIENIDHHSVGTGLGMPICKQIIEDGHAGKIWIESEYGVGTTLLFRLPVS